MCNTEKAGSDQVHEAICSTFSRLFHKDYFSISSHGSLSDGEKMVVARLPPPTFAIQSFCNSVTLRLLHRLANHLFGEPATLDTWTLSYYYYNMELKWIRQLM